MPAAPDHEYCVALCTCPPEKAEEIAGELVRRRVCACVNVVAGLTSVYEWKGEIERDSESLLVIKTRADRFEELEAAVAAVHPYEVFELITLPVERGSAAYLGWIDSVLGVGSAD
ncbi:MAG: divalent-cation tolerance protein CutA [Bryobacterales bacterium]|nr:divalent-cation tolerance protein CutA [Bryobacterales bacterium]